MTIYDVQKLFNAMLAGDTLPLRDMQIHLDAAIDAVNQKLNSCYPTFTEMLNDEEKENVYDYFPAIYIRTVVVPYAVWNYYVMDEEGLQTAQQYQANALQGLFTMQRDMLYNIPEEFQADDRQGSIRGQGNTFGYRGLDLDLDGI